MGSRFFSKLVFIAVSVAPLRAAETAEQLFEKATAALQSQNFPAAEAGFRAVLKLEPRNVGALGNLGVVYSRTRQYAKAIGVYTEALKLVPKDSGLMTNLGLAYLKQEKFDSAAPVFQDLAANPANLQARELLASCWISLGKYEQALAVLNPLADEESGNPGVFYMQGVAFTRLKRTGEAHASFGKMMEMSQPAQANFLMGKASYETGDFEQAVAFLNRSIGADPQIAGGHKELGKALVSLRRDDDAERELRLAEPDDAEAAYFLGALLWRSKPKEAASLLNQARQMTPDFWGPLFYLGRLDVEQGRVAEGITLLKRAARLKPDLPAIHYQLAMAYKRTGQVAESAAALARVKELNSGALRKEIDTISPLESVGAPATDKPPPKPK